MSYMYVKLQMIIRPSPASLRRIWLEHSGPYGTLVMLICWTYCYYCGRAVAIVHVMSCRSSEVRDIHPPVDVLERAVFRITAGSSPREMTRFFAFCSGNRNLACPLGTERLYYVVHVEDLRILAVESAIEPSPWGINLTFDKALS